MKKFSRHFAPLTVMAGALACASAAQAQQTSSVQIYGVMDAGVEYVNNVGSGFSLTRMPTNTNTTPSRLGFRGNEDLGSGLSAVFALEMGLDPGTGASNQGGRLFGRQALVGLKSGLGTVTLGRLYTMTFWSGINADIHGGGIYGTGSLDSYLPNARADNALGWMFNKSGWTLGATYSLGRDTVNAGPSPAGTNCAGESGADSSACREWSLMAKYDTSNWGVALANDRIYGRTVGPAPDAVFGGLNSSSKSDSRLIVNGWVKLDQTKIGAGVIRRSNDGLPARPDSDMWHLGVLQSLTPQMELSAQWVDMRYRGASAFNANLFSVRGTYNLSKRTAVYAQTAHIRNNSSSAVSVSGGAPGSNPAAGKGQTGFNVGVRHAF
jgi:predicted porin